MRAAAPWGTTAFLCSTGPSLRAPRRCFVLRVVADPAGHRPCAFWQVVPCTAQVLWVTWPLPGTFPGAWLFLGSWLSPEPAPRASDAHLHGKFGLARMKLHLRQHNAPILQGPGVVGSASAFACEKWKCHFGWLLRAKCHPRAAMTCFSIP